MRGGKEPERSCGGRTGFPKAGCVKCAMAPAGFGVMGRSGRKTENPRGRSPPDLFHGALRVRAGNSCWLPRFRTIIKYLLSSHCVQREFQKDGTQLNSFPLLTAADLGISEEGAIMGFPKHTWGFRREASSCLALASPITPWPLSSCFPGRKGEEEESHACTHTHTDTRMQVHLYT